MQYILYIRTTVATSTGSSCILAIIDSYVIHTYIYSSQIKVCLTNTHTYIYSTLKRIMLSMIIGKYTNDIFRIIFGGEDERVLDEDSFVSKILLHLQSGSGIGAEPASAILPTDLRKLFQFIDNNNDRSVTVDKVIAVLNLDCISGNSSTATYITTAILTYLLSYVCM